MSSGDRFYQLELRHRPVLNGDIGSLIKIEGLVVGGENARAVLLLPNTDWKGFEKVQELSIEEWTEYLQRSDNPEVLIMPAKAFHRKVRYEISGFVQQKIWLADGLKCMFCGVPIGKAPLTIDHFEPLEFGGKNDTSNYLSCCRACNKSKGSMPADEWCKLRGLDYEFYVKYLAERKVS